MARGWIWVFIPLWDFSFSLHVRLGLNVSTDPSDCSTSYSYSTERTASNAGRGGDFVPLWCVKTGQITISLGRENTFNYLLHYFILLGSMDTSHIWHQSCTLKRERSQSPPTVYIFTCYHVTKVSHLHPMMRTKPVFNCIFFFLTRIPKSWSLKNCYPDMCWAGLFTVENLTCQCFLVDKSCNGDAVSDLPQIDLWNFFTAATCYLLVNWPIKYICDRQK